MNVMLLILILIMMMLLFRLSRSVKELIVVKLEDRLIRALLSL